MPRPRAALICSLIVVATAVAYLPAMLEGGFIWDDDIYVTGNPMLFDFHGLWSIWNGSFHVNYFPLVWSMFWLEWHVFGTTPMGWHVVNVCLHICASLLIYAVLRQLRLPAAGWAALLWAVHPVNVASVAWVTEGKNTLSAIFYALTVLAYLRGKDGPALVAYLLALLAKSSGLALPLVLPLFAWWQQGSLQRRDVLRALPFLGCSAVMAGVTIYFEHTYVFQDVDPRPEGALARLATAGMALWFYLYKALCPLNLSMIYPRWDGGGVSLLGGFAWLAAVAVVALLWFKRGTWGRGPLVGVAWYVLMLLPMLGLVKTYFFMYSFVADHWQYLALVATLTAVTHLLLVVPRRPLGGTVVYAAAVLACMALTWLQCGNYAGFEALWQATMRANPDCWVAYYNLGALAEKQGDPARAEEFFRSALRVRPSYAPAHWRLGIILRQQGHFDEAIAQLEAASEERPHHPQTQFDVGVTLGQEQRYAEAIPHYQAAVDALAGGATMMAPPQEQAQAQARVHSNLALALMEVQRYDEAVREASKAVDLYPEEQVRYYYAYVLERAGQMAPAAAAYEEIVAKCPQCTEALSRLAFVLATARQAPPRDPARALTLARQVCDATGHSDSEALDALAAALAATGHFKEASDTAHQAAHLASADQRRDIEHRASLYEIMEPFYSGRP